MRANTQHRTCTAQTKLNWKYFPETAVPTGDTESDRLRLDPLLCLDGWRGCRVKRTDTIRVQNSKWEHDLLGDAHRSLICRPLCGMCLWGFSFACAVYAMRVLVSVCVITFLRNQFPLGCAKDSGADVWFVKLEQIVSESLGGGPPEPNGMTSVIP